MVQEHQAEYEEPEHHGEGTGVVRKGRWDETLKLGVLKRPNRDLLIEWKMPNVKDKCLIADTHSGVIQKHTSCDLSNVTIET